MCKLGQMMEVILPVSLDEGQRLFLRHLFVQEIGAFMKTKSFDLNSRFSVRPELEVLKDGRVVMRYINGTNLLSVSYREFYVITKKIVEDLLVDFNIVLPPIRLTEMDPYLPNKEEALRLAKENPKKFGNPRWYQYFFEDGRSRICCDVQNVLYADYENEVEQTGVAALKRFTDSLRPYAHDLQAVIECKAIAYIHEKNRRENVFMGVDEVEIPFSFQGGEVRRFESIPPLELCLNGHKVAVWFSGRDKDGIPMEVSFQWSPREGQTIVHSFARGKFYFVADFFDDIELVFDDLMLIKTVKEAATIGITLQMQDYLTQDSVLT